VGYYTSYEVTVTGFNDADEAEFAQFKLKKAVSCYPVDITLSGRTGKKLLAFETDDIMWYMWESELIEFSRTFPHLRIEIHGEGEENGDMWKARIQNGEVETVEAELTFPNFKKMDW